MAEPVVTAPTADERSVWKEEFTPREQDALGMRPVTEGGMLYCGNTEQEYAIGGVTYTWPKSIRKLRWSLNFSRLGQLTDLDFKDVATVWFGEFEAAQGQLEFEYTQNTRLANILYTIERLDGPSGVLADARLPTISANQDTQLIVRFDDSEGYTLSDKPGQGEIGIRPVGGHETLHTLGLGHQPFNIRERALIQAMYDPLIITLQAPDIKELQRRYGPPTTVKPPPPTQPIKGKTFSYKDGDDSVQVTVEYPSENSVFAKVDIQKGSKKVTLSGPKNW